MTDERELGDRRAAGACSLAARPRARSRRPTPRPASLRRRADRAGRRAAPARGRRATPDSSETREREQQHAAVDRDLVRGAARSSRRARWIHVEAPDARTRRPSAPPASAEQHALGQQLPHDARAAGAERRADGDLLLPRRARATAAGWRRWRTRSAARSRPRRSGSAATAARRRRPAPAAARRRTSARRSADRSPGCSRRSRAVSASISRLRLRDRRRPASACR